MSHMIGGVCGNGASYDSLLNVYRIIYSISIWNYVQYTGYELGNGHKIRFRQQIQQHA